MITLGGPPLGE